MVHGALVVRTLNPSRQYNGRFTLFVMLACIVGSSGDLIFGYDIEISSGVTSMNDFLLKFFPAVYEQKHTAHESDYCKHDSQILQLFSSSLYIAGLITSFASSWLAINYGQKNPCSMRVCLLSLALFEMELHKMWPGFSTQAVPMYLSEMGPVEYRGAFNILFQLSCTLGIVVANMINYRISKMSKEGWRVSLGPAVVLAIVLICGGLFCPESPNSLIEQNLKEEGKRVLQKIRGTTKVDAEYEDIVEAAKLANQVTNPYCTLLSKKYRPQLVSSILIPFFQQLTGINVVMFYAPVLFSTIGFGDDAALYLAVIVGVVNIVSTFVSIALVDRVGRRALFLEGGIQMIICQIIIASVLGTQFGGDKILAKEYGSLVLSMICLFVAAFAWSWGPLGWLVPSEILPMEVRSAGLAIVVSINLLLTFIIAQVFLTILCHMQYEAFLFFTVWEALATVFIYFFVLETKNIPIEEVSLIWNDHWFWKRIVKGKTSEFLGVVDL